LQLACHTVPAHSHLTIILYGDKAYNYNTKGFGSRPGLSRNLAVLITIYP
jgi:hypothetical protein